jgi:hypothetical protein
VYRGEKKTLTQNEIILEIPHYGLATSIASKRDVWDVITILLFSLIVHGAGKVEWTIGCKIWR